MNMADIETVIMELQSHYFFDPLLSLLSFSQSTVRAWCHIQNHFMKQKIPEEEGQVSVAFSWESRRVSTLRCGPRTVQSPFLQ